MEAIDLDYTLIRYKLVKPIIIWNKLGQQILQNISQDYFEISSDGSVRLIKNLEDMDFSRIRLTIQAQDIERDEQTGIGVLDITITKQNDIAPKFPRPWSVSNQNLYFSVLENQSAGHYVGSVTATDPYDQLDSYKITYEDIPDLFVVDKKGI